MNLRPYQQEFVSGVAKGFMAGYMRQLGVLPTGGGKTICFAHIANRFHERRQEKTLVLAHREELIEQAADKINKATGLVATVEKAERRADKTSPVVVASIQTMQGDRLASWDQDHFGLVVCDEAHHVLADQWQKTLGHFRSRVLGVTATPDRGDKRNLATYFENLAYECNLLDLIGQEFLSPVIVKSVPLKIDINAVRVSNGDYDSNALDAAITPYLKEIARYLATECKDRKKIVAFLPLIQTSKRFVEECQAVGIDARHVDGQSPDRKDILADYGAGKFRLLSNAMLLTEGWDEPGVDCLLVLRPTKSRSLFCLDEETEVLTESGWKKDVEVGEMVAGFDPKSNEIRYVPAMAKIRRPLDDGEKWISMNGPSCDIRVTGDHRMLYDHKKKTGWKFKTAKCLAALKDSSYLPCAGFVKSEGVPLTDDELRFIGWVMTDGTISKSTGGIAITQGEHQPWINEIDRCLEGCGFKFTKRTTDRVSQFTSNSRCIRWTISKGSPRSSDKHLRGWGSLEKWIDKDFSPLLMNVSRKQFGVLAEAIHLGDGSKQSGQSWTRRSYHITSGRKIFCDRLQITAIKNGWRANVSTALWNENPMYVIHMKDQPWRRVGGSGDDRPSWKECDPSPGEMCWCIENEMGTLITRRNGKTVIMGNCQMVGRGTRLHPDKKNLLLMDFLWLHERHDLARPASLIARNKEEEEAITKALDGKEKDLAEALEDAENEREAALIRKIAENAAKRERFIPIEQVGALLKDRKIMDYEPVFGWERAPVTEKQRNVLDRFGLSCRTKGEASMVMNRLFDRSRGKLATVKQLTWLVRFNHPSPETCTQKEAKAFLDERFKRTA